MNPQNSAPLVSGNPEAKNFFNRLVSVNNVRDKSQFIKQKALAMRVLFICFVIKSYKPYPQEVQEPYRLLR